MAIVFEVFSEAHKPAVLDFNARISGFLEPGLELPEDPALDWLPKGGHPKIYQEVFLALENSTVRGGYVLKYQDFAVNGAAQRVASYRLPISEGVTDRAYASLGLQILRNSLSRQPMLFSLGMGALDRPLPKMQKALGWGQYPVPFYFRVVRGASFVRNIAPLRTTAARRLAGDIAAGTGLAALGTSIFRIARHPRIPAGIRVESFRGFGAWADDLWNRCQASYSLIAVRDADIANTLYPSSNQRFLFWKVVSGDRVLGWAVCLDTQMRSHKQFGGMRIATIVDGLAGPSDAGVLLAAVTRELERRPVDMIISNQMHAAWGAGLKAAGFLEGPSNFIFSASRKLTETLAPFDTGVKRGHINRGDGDGPIHL